MTKTSWPLLAWQQHQSEESERRDTTPPKKNHAVEEGSVGRVTKEALVGSVIGDRWREIHVCFHNLPLITQGSHNNETFMLDH